MGFVNITPQVEEAVRKSGVREGLVLVNAMHITASVFINDDEPGLHDDYKQWLEQLAPFDPSPQRYHHNRTGEDNADAHLKRQVMGREVVVAITEGQARLRPLGADLLRRVRRPPAQAGAGQGHRGVTGGEAETRPAKRPAAKAAKPRKPTAKAARKPQLVVDASAELAALGFFRGEYHWETDRLVPSLDARLRVLVDHHNGIVTPEQVRRGSSACSDTETPLRPLAVRAAYESMLRSGRRLPQAPPGVSRQADRREAIQPRLRTQVGAVPLAWPDRNEASRRFILTLFWPDDTRPCEARYEWVKGKWVVTECERI